MKKLLINSICLIIIVASFYGLHKMSGNPEATEVRSVVELDVHPSSLPQLYENQIYVVQKAENENETYIFDDISQINLPESNWKIYLVVFTDKPSEFDIQNALKRIRFMYKNGVYDADVAEQVNQANTQETRLLDVSAQATAEAETGYNPGSNITINDSNCIAVGVEGNTQSVNCNLTPQP